jgi:signal transduction histidine kinase
MEAVQSIAARRSVDLVFAREGDWVVIMVGNDGAHAGAAGQMPLPQPADRTVRADAGSPQAGQARLGQTGLGLSRIRTVIELYGGMIDTRSFAFGGMSVKLNLLSAWPLPPPRPPPLSSLGGGEQ